MPVWPPDLPPPAFEGYAREGEDVTIRTAVETGPAVTRPRTRRPRARVRADWLFDVDQADRWQQWWEVDARYGTRPFVWYEPLRGRPGRWQAIGAEQWQIVSPQQRRLTLELQALEEWWPGWLAGAGRTIRIWDPRWPSSLAETSDGRRVATFGGPVSIWYDRLRLEYLAAPTDAARPSLTGDEWPDRIYTGGSHYMQLSMTMPMNAWAIAAGVALDPASAANGRIAAMLPGASGNDHDQATGVAIWSADGTDVQVRSSIYNLVYDTAAQLGTIAIVAVGAGTTSELRIDDIVRASQTGINATGTSPGPFRIGAGQVGGAVGNYGRRGYYGVALITGYVPTGVERTMLSRWAMAMAGKDPFD